MTTLLTLELPHACRLWTGLGARKVARRFGFALFGVFNGTELNPDFFDDMLKNIDNEVGAILVCNMGGTLDATEGNGAGTQSRQAILCHKLHTSSSSPC